MAERVQKIVLSFIVPVADPKAFDLVAEVIARFTFVDGSLVEGIVGVRALEFPVTARRFPVLQNIFPVNSSRELSQKSLQHSDFCLQQSVPKLGNRKISL
jgi:hypothetical protein